MHLTYLEIKKILAPDQCSFCGIWKKVEQHTGNSHASKSNPIKPKYIQVYPSQIRACPAGLDLAHASREYLRCRCHCLECGHQPSVTWEDLRSLRGSVFSVFKLEMFSPFGLSTLPPPTNRSHKQLRHYKTKGIANISSFRSSPLGCIHSIYLASPLLLRQKYQAFLWSHRFFWLRKRVCVQCFCVIQALHMFVKKVEQCFGFALLFCFDRCHLSWNR